MECVGGLETRYVERQAGGHSAANGNAILANLQRSDGTFLKLIRDSPRSQVEVDFYEDIFSSPTKQQLSLEDEDRDGLRRILPNYHGLSTTFYNDKEVQYLVLEDLTWRCRLPCVLDVKLKAHVHDPDTDHQHPVIPIAVQMGFLIDGITVYRKGRYETSSKSEGRRLSETGVQQELWRFVNGNRGLVLSFIERLRSVESWATTQTSYHFYRSSLLFVYDAAAILTPVTTSSPNFHNVTDIRLIDFAKVHPSTDTDHQLISCLQRLRSTFQLLLNKSTFN